MLSNWQYEVVECSNRSKISLIRHNVSPAQCPNEFRTESQTLFSPELEIRFYIHVVKMARFRLITSMFKCLVEYWQFGMCMSLNPMYMTQIVFYHCVLLTK